MKLTNISGFETIEEYITHKLDAFSRCDRSFSSLFDYMFSETQNTMSELSDGYRIVKTAYGEVKDQILRKIVTLSKMLDAEGEIVGIYMDNSLDWIKVFWAVLACGRTPLLMNKRLPKEVLENVLHDHHVGAVITDGEVFSVKTIDRSALTEDCEPAAKPLMFGKEVIFMSSGTTESVKLCVYTAENFFYQIANSVDIVKKCPAISANFEGELKLLTLLPFYHIFGFIAVYLWFGFFSRTFVFLRDMTPKTIQSTVKKHKVTHIFAVPMVWDKVYKTVLSTAQSKGGRTYKKLMRAVRLSNGSSFSHRLLHGKLSQVREQIFGDSIKFLISGGGYISNEVLEFYNGIGYHMVNGYGMTEVGITSVEISDRAKLRNMGAIGDPFLYTQYSINSQGQLLIKGKSMASRIYGGDGVTVIDHDEWFNSGDLVNKTKFGYFLQGRSDDLIISSTGENINPRLIESALRINGAESICLLASGSQITLLINTKYCYSSKRAQNVLSSAKSELSRIGMLSAIDRICLTPDPFMAAGEYKVSRRKLAKRLADGSLTLIDETAHASSASGEFGDLEKTVLHIFAEVLQKPGREISADDNFFTVLGGSSIEYFMLADAVSERFGVDIKSAEGKSLHTVNEICSYIKKQ